MSEQTYTKEQCEVFAAHHRFHAIQAKDKANLYLRLLADHEQSAAHWKQLAADIEAKEGK